MHPAIRYPVLRSLVKHFPKNHRTNFMLVMGALLDAGTARSFSIAHRLCVWLNILFQSALNRFYRFLGNHRFDELALTKRMLGLLSQRMGRRLLISLDWTEWHDDLRMLVASVTCGKRAIPVYCAAFEKSNIPRSQNSRENAFLSVLDRVLKDLGLDPIIFCDRGFRRASWLKQLEEKGLRYVVRLKSDVCVTPKSQAKIRLDAIGLQRGQSVDLGRVKLRCDGVMTVRVVGAWQRGMKEQWWLATNLRAGVRKLASYYDRRMTIEEQFRDSKGCHFGVKLYWTQFKNPQHLGRMAMLVGVAMMLWTAVGVAATQDKTSMRFPHPTKGPRRSYVDIGLQAFSSLAISLKLTALKVALLLPEPELRNFAWLSTWQETT
jgi:hypothetical protein